MRVECYSGHKAEERPVRFELDGHGHMVEELLNQWHSPEARYLKVRGHDGNLHVLRHSIVPQEDTWTLESFRRA